MRIDLDYKDGTYTNLRSIQQLNLPKQQQDLENLVWRAQDALNDLVVESETQRDCLVGIEKLFKLLEPVHKPAEQASAPGVAEAIKTHELGVQVGSVGENLPYFRDMEFKFYKRMMESFYHLRFTVEIVSPFEIHRPLHSEQVTNSEG
jgi:hypothetical protein